MIEYSLTKDDLLAVFTELATLATNGRLPGAALFGGPKQQVNFALASDVLPVGRRQVWADDGGLNERRGEVAQTFRWWALSETVLLERFVVVLQSGLADDVPAFAAIALVIPRGLPGGEELCDTIAHSRVFPPSGSRSLPEVPQTAEIGLRGRLSAKDYLAANQAFRKSAAARRQLLTVVLLGLLVGTGVGFLLGFVLHLGDLPVSPPLFGAVGALIGAGFIWGSVVWSMPRQAQNLVDAGVYKTSFGAWWCDDEGFHEEVEGRAFSVAWTGIDHVQRIDGVAIVWLGSAYAILVPCRDLQGRQVIDAVERSLAQRVGG